MFNLQIPKVRRNVVEIADVMTSIANDLPQKYQCYLNDVSKGSLCESIDFLVILKKSKLVNRINMTPKRSMKQLKIS